MGLGPRAPTCCEREDDAQGEAVVERARQSSARAPSLELDLLADLVSTDALNAIRFSLEHVHIVSLERVHVHTQLPALNLRAAAPQVQVLPASSRSQTTWT